MERHEARGHRLDGGEDLARARVPRQHAPQEAAHRRLIGQHAPRIVVERDDAGAAGSQTVQRGVDPLAVQVHEHHVGAHGADPLAEGHARRRREQPDRARARHHGFEPGACAGAPGHHQHGDHAATAVTGLPYRE